MRTLLAFVAVIGAVSCAQDKPMPNKTSPASSAIVVTTSAEAKAALGKLVRATGTVQREKPGDSLNAPGLDILCPDFRFDDALVGTTVTIEGTLRQISLPESTVNERGEISQGVMPGSPPRFAIDDCAPVAD